MSRFASPGLAMAATVLLAGSASAGIVILKNGKVFVGKIDAEEDTEEDLVVRWPYGERRERGEMVVPKFRIRWYSREHDEPTEAYWEQYEDAPIENKYLPLLEKWRLRKKAEDDYINVPLILETGPKGKLSLRPVQTRFFELRKPEGWTSRTEEGITIFESDQPGEGGFRPRIHVFSVESIQDSSTEEQVTWITEEIARLGEEGGFSVEQEKRPRVVSGGLDAEMLTSTTRDGAKFLALRKVAFRKKRTYFYTAYAHEKDFSAYGLLFEQCLGSLVILEDSKADVDVSSGGGEDGRG